jgi:hypothetical protein
MEDDEAERLESDIFALIFDWTDLLPIRIETISDEQYKALADIMDTPDMEGLEAHE